MKRPGALQPIDIVVEQVAIFDNEVAMYERRVETTAIAGVEEVWRECGH